MSFHLVLTVAIVVAIAFYVSIFNPGSIDFNLTRNVSYQIPLVVIILAAIFVGAFLVAFMNIVNAFGRGISHLQSSVYDSKLKKIHRPYDKGMEYLEAGYNKEAEEEFRKVLDKDPKHLPSLIELGKLMLIKGNGDEAVKLHNRAFVLDKGNLEIAFSLAEDYAAVGRYQKARSILEEAKGLGGDRLVTLNKLRNVCMAGGLWEEALKAQKEIVQHTGDIKQAEKERGVLNGIHHELGQAALEEGRSGDALKEFRAILKSERRFAPAYAGMGDAYLAVGKENEALRAWEEGYSATSCISLLKKQEVVFMKKEDPGSVISLYKKAMALNPENAGINYLLGLMYLRLEMMEEALQEFKTVQEKGMAVPGMWSLMANIYEKTDKQELAAQEYKREIDRLGQSLSLFKCSSCGEPSPQWKGRCERCGEWNTYQINIEKIENQDEKVIPPPSTGT